MSWSSVIGQQRVKRLLKKFHETGRFPHALLFFGPDGVGKEAMAIELARTLNCERGQWDTCGVCPSCRQMHALRHPQLKLIFALPSKQDEDTAIDKLSEDEMEEMNAQIDLKAANPYHRITMSKAAGIKISSIRDIRREASYRATGKGRAVVVICEAERMNPSASNALLKTLEEPTGDLLLILATSKRDALLQTIISRCQQIRFDPLTEEEIISALEKEPDIRRESIPIAAQLANGSYTAALEIAREDGLMKREEIVKFLRCIVTGNPIALMEKIQGYTSKDDRKSLARFLSGLEGWFRDVLVLQEGAPERIRNIDLKSSLEKFADHYPETRCADAIETIESVIDMMQKNVHLVTLMIVLSQRLRRCIITETT